MPDFFDTVTKKFSDVPQAEGISIPEFLEATENLIRLFDILGSTAFGIVKSDMTGNVEKIRKVYKENPKENATLQSMVKNEIAKTGKPNPFATEGLMWLKRALEFTALGIRSNVDNPTEELKDSFLKSYEKTLKPHHGMLVRPVFALAMKAVPFRKDFYAKLVENPATDIDTKVKPWIAGLEEKLSILVKFYVDLKLEQPPKY